MTTGVVTTLAGSGSLGSADGTANVASFYRPHGVTLSASGSTAIISDTLNEKLRLVSGLL